MDITKETEEKFIEDIKQSILDTSLKVSQKVIKSAHSFLKTKDCLNNDKDDIIQEFFIKKIPKVLSSEISNVLNKTLGLNLEIE